MQNQTETQAFSASAGGSVEKALYSFQDLLHQELSKARFAEEREWYEEALFYQRRQWLKYDDSNKRWSVIKQDPQKPRPMPVTNHFARTINANANQLGAGQMKVQAIPSDDSDANRRAAAFAETAVDAIDEETGMRVLQPLLAKHTVLWGIGVTKDTFDASAHNGITKVPQIEVQSTPKLGCMDCGQVADLSPEMAMQPGAPLPGAHQAPCPYCGGSNTIGWKEDQPVVTEVKQFANGRLCTEVRPIFEFFAPRDCQNPNLAKKLQQRYRKPLGEVKRLWGDEDVKADDKQETHEIYLEALRSLVNYNYMHDQTNDGVTITESWCDFDQLPEQLQKLLVDEVGGGAQSDEDEDADEGNPLEGNGGESSSDEPMQLAGSAADGDSDESEAGGGDDEDQDDISPEFPDPDLDPVEQLQQWGIFIVAGGGKVLDWGVNNCEGKKAPTFWMWEVDPANVYPKGLGSDLIPLQKRLNRIDSLIELAMMANAAGKWLWPTTQSTKPPTGVPTDVVEYDPIGDGKIAPTFVLPTPFHASVWTLRQAIKQDFQEIGMTEGVQAGMTPQGVTSFRGLAYMGAKGQEQINTPRMLWEMAAKLRYEKCLVLARRNWTEERKVAVAGFNGRWGMQKLFGEQLKGDYVIRIVPNSSRPKTFEEKEQGFQMMLMAGLVDMGDPAVREWVASELNMDEVDMVNHLQYQKAERDLDQVIAGQMPALNPYINISIFFTVFTKYTLTEEFEEQPPDAQQRVLLACQMLSEQMAAQAAEVAAHAAATASQGKQLGAALQKKNQGGGNPLDRVPGNTTTPDAASHAAETEGAQVAAAAP